MGQVWVGGCEFALAGLLLAERRDAQAGRWLCKPLASLCFCGLALAQGATATPLDRLVLAGQLLGLIGDVLLIGRGQAAFAR